MDTNPLMAAPIPAICPKGCIAKVRTFPNKNPIAKNSDDLNTYLELKKYLDSNEHKTIKEGFEKKYINMLQAGGSKHHKDLLAPFGLDASDPKFWDKGLSMISGFIDELEAMEN